MPIKDIVKEIARTKWGISFALAFPLVIMAYITADHDYVVEFDYVHLRMRKCTEHTLLGTKIPIWTDAGESMEFDLGTRLREIGVMPPIREKDAKWKTVGKPEYGVWGSPGSYFIRGLGHNNLGLTNEERDKNPWIRWAKRDPSGWTEFWRRLSDQRNARPGVVVIARKHLDDHEGAMFADLQKAISEKIGHGF